MEAQIKAATSKAIKNFRSSEEYCYEKIKFATYAYDKKKCFVWGRVVAHYLELNLYFLDEVLEPPIVDAVDASVSDDISWIFVLSFCFCT